MLLGGKNLQLVPYEAQHWAYIAKWFHLDAYNRMFRHMPRAMTQKEFESYPQIISGSVFLIMDKESSNIIGMIQMVPDYKTNRAFYLGLIIDEEYQGKRHPFEAVAILFNYAFNRMGYQKAIIEIVDTHDRLKKILNETGFLSEGKLYKEAFLEGKFVDELRYTMFAEYFNKKHGEMVKSWVA